MFVDFFQNKSFTNTIRVSNGFDQGQDRQNLGPICLQRLSADDKVAASTERVQQIKI